MEGRTQVTQGSLQTLTPAGRAASHGRRLCVAPKGTTAGAGSWRLRLGLTALEGGSRRVASLQSAHRCVGAGGVGAGGRPALCEHPFLGAWG